MGRPLFPAPRLGAFPFRVANLAAFLEDLLHERIVGLGPARAPPILDSSRSALTSEQGADLFFQRRHSFLKRRSGHDGSPGKRDGKAGSAAFGKRPFTNVNAPEKKASSK